MALTLRILWLLLAPPSIFFGAAMVGHYGILAVFGFAPLCLTALATGVEVFGRPGQESLVLPPSLLRRFKRANVR